jgi:hypothetical protein
VDVGDHRDLALQAMIGKRVGVLLARAGDPDDVATGRRQLGDLLQRGVDVVRLGGAHRLHRDRVVAAHADVAQHDLTGLAPRGQHGRRRGRQAQINGHLSLSYWNSLIGLTRSAVTVSSHVADHHDQDHVA